MKIYFFDYFLNFIAGAFVLTVASSSGVLFARWIGIPYLGDYHILAEAAVFILSAGLACALVVRAASGIPKFHPGNFDPKSSEVSRWKLCQMYYQIGKSFLAPFTPLLLRPLVAALFGAKLGRELAIGGKIVDPYLVSMGDEVILGEGSMIAGHLFNNGVCLIAPVRIGKRVTIGGNAMVNAGCEIGEGTTILFGSVIPPNKKIPGYEVWGGTPAQKIRSLKAELV